MARTWFWHPYGLSQAMRNGRLDARRNQPSADCDEPVGYLLGLKNHAEDIMQDMLAQWHRADERLSARVRDAIAGHELENERLKQMERDYPDHAATSRAHFWHWIVLVILGLTEFPLNSIVFRLFGEAEVLTYIVAFGLAMVLMGCAYFCARNYKIASIADGHVAHKGRLWGTIVLAIFLIVTVAVAALRVQYLKQMGEEVSFSTTLAFLMIQLGLFVGGFIATYLASDPLAEQQDKVLHAERRVNGAIEHRHRAHHGLAADAQAYIERCQQSAARYSQANLNTREDGQTPPLFRGLEDKLGLTVPEGLSGDLKWPEEARPFLNNQ